MPRQLSLAHLTVLDTTPPELVSVAAAAGFHAVGIRLTAPPSVGVPPYDILSEGPLLRDTLARLKDTGITVLDTEFLRFEPDRPVGIPEGFLEVSARLGARHVLVMSAEPDEGRTLERFGDLCDRAARYGLRVGLEFAVYTGVRTLAHAVQMVGRANARERLGRGGRAPLQPIRRAAGAYRRCGPVAVSLCADLRRVRGHARPHRLARAHPRGANGAATSGRGRSAPARSRGRAAPGLAARGGGAVPGHSPIFPPLERARRAYRALAALLETQNQ